MPKDRINLDYETFSEVDLTKVGGGRYFRHPSTEALMVAFKFNGGETQQVSYAEGEDEPAWFAEAMVDPEVEKWAWNAPFEIGIRQHTQCHPVHLDQWRDTMVLSQYCGFPGKLEKAGPAMGFPLERCKMPEGKTLMRRFSIPRAPTKTMSWTRVEWWRDPKRWQLYLEYNRRDVEIESDICDYLMDFNLPFWEWELWAEDQQINERGLPINLDMVANAIRIYEAAFKEGLNEMTQITGLDNPMAPAQLLPWLRDRDYPFHDLKKGHVKRAIQWFDEPPGNWDKERRELYCNDMEMKRALVLRRDLARTSIKKYYALDNATDREDDVIRGTLQFYAAQRTGRWGGRLFQPQNLARPDPEFEKNIEWHAENVQLFDLEMCQLVYGSTFDLLASTIRPAAQAPDGYVFLDADLNAIENRVLGWIAQCSKILDVFRNRMDPYIAFAVYLYEMAYEDLWHEYKVLGDKGKRTISKPGVLGCLKGDTPVLTDKGWKAIVEITTDDWLHDGEKWVRHEGVVFKGYQEVLCGSGLHATPDHRFLTEEGWQEWQSVSRQQMFKSALVMGNGVFLKKRGLLAAQEKSFYADVNVVESGRYHDQTSCAGYPLVAPDALRLTVAPRSENESAQTFTTYSQIVSTLQDRVAKTKRTVPTVITGDAEYVAYSVPQTSGCPMSRELSGPMGLWKSTESTTMGIMNGGTSGSQLDLNRTQIADTWDILNTGDYARFAVLTESGCVVAHNCGYMLGAGREYENEDTGEMEATGLLGYAWNMGVRQFTLADSELSVDTFRREFSEVKDYWYGVERACKRVIRTGEPMQYGHVWIDLKGDFMRIELPSKRHLHYHRPKIERKMMPWGKEKDVITYMNQNDKKQWVRTQTHPGKITENIDQAISRDLLAHGMRIALRRGLDIRLHVHDQILALSPEDKAEKNLEILIDSMEEQPAWAEGLPLGSEGFVAKMFQKD